MRRRSAQESRSSAISVRDETGSLAFHSPIQLSRRTSSSSAHFRRAREASRSATSSAASSGLIKGSVTSSTDGSGRPPVSENRADKPRERDSREQGIYCEKSEGDPDP